MLRLLAKISNPSCNSFTFFSLFFLTPPNLPKDFNVDEGYRERIEQLPINLIPIRIEIVDLRSVCDGLVKVISLLWVVGNSVAA